MKQVQYSSFLLLFILIMAQNVAAQDKSDEDAEMLNQAELRDRKAIEKAKNGWWAESMKNHEERIEWWREARFGMFVHWGVYSTPGGEWKGKKVTGYSEHLMRKEKIARAEYYENVVKSFNPVDFNADEWIKTASNAGMKYFIITAKHHDGFAMFDSDVTDYNIVDATKFAKDPMIDLAAACKKYGVKFGFYYSHAFDWEHPDAPGNDWDYNNPGGDLNLFGGRNWYDVHPELLPKAIKYVDEKAIPQIKELLVKYHPDILWFDTPHKLPLSENIRILEEIRKIDNNVVVNGRLARFDEGNFGDYQNTADRPLEFFPVEGDWEAIPTTNESYGYHKFDDSHKPISSFIYLLAKAASRGGNLLMNIGPRGDGKIDDKDQKILKGISDWMQKNGESIYGTQKSPLALQNWGVCTQKETRLYLHVFNWPKNEKLVVGGLQTLPERAALLTDFSKSLSVKKLNNYDVEIHLPKKTPDKVNTVIVLEMDQAVLADQTRLLESENDNQLLAFDAKLVGGGFGFGDGKTDRYYVNRWGKTSQTVNWPFRLNENMEAELSLRYQVNGKSGGEAKIKIGDTEFLIEIQPSEAKDQIRNVKIGKCILKAGSGEIQIIPQKITGDDLMQIFEMHVTPVENN